MLNERTVFVSELFLLFLTLFFPSVTSAVSASDAASFFAYANEKTNVTQFSAEDASYYMVKINGREAIVLQERAGDFYPVESEDALQKLVEAYSSGRFAYSIDAVRTNFPAIAASYANLSQSVSDCAHAVDYFYSLSGPDSAFFIASHPRFFGQGCPGIKTNQDSLAANTKFLVLNDSYKNFSASRVQLEHGFLALTNISSSSSPEQDVAELVSALNKMEDAYPPVYDGYAGIKEYCTYAFGSSACASKELLSRKKDVLLNELGGGTTFNTGVLVARIVNETSFRKNDAMLKKIAFTRDHELLELIQEKEEYEKRYNSVKEINFIGLNAKINALKNLLSVLKQADVLEDAATEAEAFDQKFNETRFLMDSMIFLYEKFKESVAALSNSSNAVAVAIEKWGENDARVVELKKKQAAAQVEFDGVETDLMVGKVVYASALENIQESAQEIYAQATNLAPEFPVLIVVLVLLVAGGAGGYWFLKKRKKSNVYGVQPKHEKIIDIRKLLGRKGD